MEMGVRAVRKMAGAIREKKSSETESKKSLV